MEIKMEDVGKIRRMIGRMIGDQMGLGEPDTVMVPRYGEVNEGNIHFLKGPEDLQLFESTEPEAYRFVATETNMLYELLSAIDDQLTTPRFVVESGLTVQGWIDLGSMLEDRTLIGDIDLAMANLVAIRGRSPHRPGDDVPELEEQIVRDLRKLCKDDAGAATALGLWEKYSNQLKSERPDFIPSRPGQWYQDNRLKVLSPTGTVVAPDISFLRGPSRSAVSGEFSGMMASLGSFLDFSETSILAGRREGSLEERQYFGPPEKLDRIDINWQLENGRLLGYNITLKKHIDIPHRVMAGVDLEDLEARMRRFDWQREHMNFNEEFPLLAGIANDIKRLYGYWRSEDVRNWGIMVAFKYWGYTPNEDVIPGILRLKSDYEKRITLKPEEGMVSVLQAYNLLQGRAIGQTNIDGIWKWRALDPTSRTPDGSRVLVPLSAGDGFDPLAAIRHIGGKPDGIEDFEAVRNGSKMLLPVELDGTTAERIVFADPSRRTIVIDKGEGESYGLYRVTDEELFDGRYSRLKESVQTLTRQADYLGISTENLVLMENDVLLRNSDFSLTQSEMFGSDVLKYSFLIKFDGEGRFRLAQINADLRRDFIESKPVIAGISIEELRRRMGAVDWSRDFISTGSVAFHLDHAFGEREMQMSVMDLRRSLEGLFFSKDPEGAQVAASLALKFLKDTPNEDLVPSLRQGMEQLRLIVSFQPSPQFTLEAMYNLMKGRPAVARTINGEGKPERRVWYKLNKGAGENSAFPVSIVSAGFSVLEALKQYDVLESRVPALLSKAAWHLEDGGLFPVTLSRKDFSVPLVVSANPGTESLLVDFGETLRRAGDPVKAREYVSTKFELGHFAKMIEGCGDIGGMIRKVDVSTGRIKVDFNEDQLENRQARGQ